jgi:uncharacterized membrane protein
VDTFPSFKNSLKRIKKITQKNDSFIFWTLLVLSVDYLALFFVESILPGYVISSLNLNFLLVFLLVGWVYYSFYGKPEKPLNKSTIKIFEIFLLIIFILGVGFVLYKIAKWELLIIFSTFFLIGYLFFKGFGKNK